MNKRILKNIDWSILICIFILVTIGLIALYVVGIMLGIIFVAYVIKELF